MQQDASSGAKEAGPGNRLDSMAILDCSVRSMWCETGTYYLHCKNIKFIRFRWKVDGTFFNIFVC